MSEKTKAQLVRERFKQRRADRTSKLFKVPFIADVDLANEAEKLTKQRENIEARIAHAAEAMADRDAAGETAEVDVRASGHDLSPDTLAIDGLERQLELIDKQLEETVEAIREGSIFIVFRTATDKEYERHLLAAESEFNAQVGEAQGPTIAFGDRLMATCFVRVESKDGTDLEYDSWDEFSQDMELTFGDVDPIRTVVYAKNRQSGSFKLPF